jgi:hypothetical protein
MISLRAYEVRHVQKRFMGESTFIYSRKHGIKRFKKALRPLVPLCTKALILKERAEASLGP